MDETISRIIQAAATLEPEEQGHFIATEAIAAARRADAAISPEALEAEFRAWWKAQAWSAPPGFHAVRIAKAWGRHLLSRGAA